MASTLSEIFANRKAPNLAVEFRTEEIALFHLEPGGWREIDACRIDAPDLNDRAANMRRIAAKRCGKKVPDVDVWLPGEQVATLELGATKTPKQAALSALTASSEISAGELIIDVARDGDAHVACATEKIVVEEARHYIRRWGFAPQRITTRHGHPAFSAGPTFGRSSEGPKKEALVGVAAALALIVGLGWLLLGWPERADDVANAPASSVEPDQVAAAAQPQEAAPLQSEERQPTQPSVAESVREKTGEEPTVAQSPAALALVERQGDVDDLRLPAGLVPAYVDLSVETSVNALAFEYGESPLPATETARLALRLEEPPLLAVEDAQPLPPTDGEAPAPALMASLGDAPEAAFEIPPLANATGPEVEAPTPPPVAQDAPPVSLDADAAQTDEEPAADAAPTLEAETEPQAAQEALAEVEAPEVDEDAPGPGAVEASPSPAPRPDKLDMTPSDYAVASAPAPSPRPASIKPRPRTATASASAPASRIQRGPPAGPGLANAATLRNALQLTEINLLGVFGQPGSRRALLRLGNGDVMRVSRGTVVDGWVVSRIEATSMRITRGGEARTLQVIQ